MVKDQDFQAMDKDQSDFDISIATLYYVHYNRTEAFRKICAEQYQDAYKLLIGVDIETIGILGEKKGGELAKKTKVIKNRIEALGRSGTKQGQYLVKDNLIEWFGLLTHSLYKSNILLRKKDFNTLALQQ